MNELLGEILEAHGGLNRWNQYQKVEATIVSGGLFPLKDVPQDSSPRRMTVWLRKERSSVFTELAPAGPRMLQNQGWGRRRLKQPGEK